MQTDNGIANVNFGLTNDGHRYIRVEKNGVINELWTDKDGKTQIAVGPNGVGIETFYIDVNQDGLDLTMVANDGYGFPDIDNEQDVISEGIHDVDPNPCNCVYQVSSSSIPWDKRTHIYDGIVTNTTGIVERMMEMYSFNDCFTCFKQNR